MNNPWNRDVPTPQTQQNLDRLMRYYERSASVRYQNPAKFEQRVIKGKELQKMEKN